MKMSTIFGILGTAVILCSCNFIKVDGKALADAFEITENSAYVKKAVVASKNYIDKEYSVEEFNAVECSGNYDIKYSDGEPFVSISAPDNIIDHLVVKVENGTLKIKTDGTNFRKVNNITATISTKELNELKISGAGDFDALKGFVTKDFKVSISGAGDLDINGLVANDVQIKVSGAGDIDIDKLDCNGITVSVSGAGDVTLAGKANSADLRISGAGDIDVTELETENLERSVSGVGRVKK